MKIGDREFQINKKTYVMGILNITPDSFSDGGKYQNWDNALKRVEKMIEEGVDIVDIGGESTRPGYTLLEEQEEIDRVIPMIEKVKSEFNIPVSLDTYKSKVAFVGISAGADMINDIWGLKYDGSMAEIIAKSGLPCCLMHNRKKPEYGDFMEDMAYDLSQSLYLAEKAGIDQNKIILDPGVGFAKSYENNLTAINQLDKLHIFNCPLLLGTSRKSVIGLTLDVPVTDRIEGTLATTVMAVMKGCMFVRVHDIKENVQVIKMTESILAEKKSVD